MKTEQSNKEMGEFETGTTTVGVVTNRGVVLAADKRASLGRMASSKHAKKVYKIADKIGLTIAGSVGDAQKIVRTMRSQLKLQKLETKEMSVGAAGTLLANILHSNKYTPFMNQFVLGGTTEEGGILYDLDPAGGLMSHSTYTATGSGSKIAYGVLEDKYQDDLSHEDGIALAADTVGAAMERDTASGDGITIAEITDEGYRTIDQDHIEQLSS